MVRILLAAQDDITQGEIAAKSGIHRTTISLIANGRRDPTDEQIAALARVFHVDPRVFNMRISTKAVVEWLNGLAAKNEPMGVVESIPDAQIDRPAPRAHKPPKPKRK